MSEPASEPENTAVRVSEGNGARPPDGAPLSSGAPPGGSPPAGSPSAGSRPVGREPVDARETGARVEELLAELRARCGQEAAVTAEELVTCLVRLYGAGLERIMRITADDSRLHARFVADPLLESLLLVHDLHPLDVGARVRRALGRLGIGAELLSVEEDGTAVVKLAHGGGMFAVADVEQAVLDAAPEVTGVRLAAREPPLLQIGRRPAESR
jgi:hypothetical protein